MPDNVRVLQLQSQRIPITGAVFISAAPCRPEAAGCTADNPAHEQWRRARPEIKPGVDAFYWSR
jgi:hypothetical protein